MIRTHRVLKKTDDTKILIYTEEKLPDDVKKCFDINYML